MSRIIGDDQPRESVAARFKAMAGSTTLRVEVVGRRAVRIEAPDVATEERAVARAKSICNILRCEYCWERTDDYITVTILERP